MLTPKYQSQANAIASYDYVDLASGTGNEVFYFTLTEDPAGTDYYLSPEVIYSKSIETSSIVASATSFGSATLDWDFDLTPFNTPRTIYGSGILQLGVVNYAETNVTADTVWNKVTINVYKVSGGTETLIGSATSPTSRTFAAVDNTYQRFIYCFPIACARTPFAIGDNLRVNYQLYLSGSGTGNTGACTIGHDPAARDGLYVSGSDTITNSNITLPFEIDTR